MNDLGAVVWTWLVGAVPRANPADQDIARHAYADFLVAQVSGFLPGNKELMQTLTEARQSLAPRTPVGRDREDILTDAEKDRADSFARLMGVETRLAGMMSDDQVARNYWIVRDRFNRVGSEMAIAEHLRWGPPDLDRPAGKTADSPLMAAQLAQTAALAEAGRTAIALAEASAAIDAAGDAATEAQQAALTAARKAHDLAVVAVKDADKRVADLTAARTREETNGSDGSEQAGTTREGS